MILRRNIKLGEDVSLAPQSLRESGRYLAIVRHGAATDSAWFYVSPGKPAGLNFLARPSRVPVDRHDVISGVALKFAIIVEPEKEVTVVVPPGVVHQSESEFQVVPLPFQ